MLVPDLYRQYDAALRDRPGPDDLAQRIENLSVAGETDQRRLFASVLLLFHLCHTDSRSTYFSALSEWTSPKPRKLRTPFADLTNAPSTPPRCLDPPLVRPKILRLPMRAARSLAPESFDPVSFWQMTEDQNISTLERAMIRRASTRVRDRAWGAMKRAYVEVRVDWAGKWLGLDEEELNEWAAKEGAKVTEGRLKLR